MADALLALLLGGHSSLRVVDQRTCCGPAVSQQRGHLPGIGPGQPAGGGHHDGRARSREHLGGQPEPPPQPAYGVDASRRVGQARVPVEDDGSDVRRTGDAVPASSTSPSSSSSADGPVPASVRSTDTPRAPARCMRSDRRVGRAAVHDHRRRGRLNHLAQHRLGLDLGRRRVGLQAGHGAHPAGEHRGQRRLVELRRRRRCREGDAGRRAHVAASPSASDATTSRRAPGSESTGSPRGSCSAASIVHGPAELHLHRAGMPLRGLLERVEVLREVRRGAALVGAGAVDEAPSGGLQVDVQVDAGPRPCAPPCRPPARGRAAPAGAAGRAAPRRRRPPPRAGRCRASSRRRWPSPHRAAAAGSSTVSRRSGRTWPATRRRARQRERCGSGAPGVGQPDRGWSNRS